MSTKKYIHCDNDECFLTLHDCCAEFASFQNGILAFEFPDGFWISPDHPLSNLERTVRTDQSKVEFLLENGEENDIVIYVFSQNLFRKTIRSVWSLDKLLDAINSRKCKLEFLYQYKDYNDRIIVCRLRFCKKPYYLECLIQLSVSKVNYFWNKLCADRTW